MEEQKAVLNDAMIGRADELDNEAYQYFMTLLGVDDKEAEEVFPWDVCILRQLLDTAVELLTESGLPVCNPAVIMEGEETRLCNPSDCGYRVCRCVDKIPYKESIVENYQKN